MNIISYIKYDQDNTLIKFCKVFWYLMMCCGLLVLPICPFAFKSNSGWITLLYTICVSAYLAIIILMYQDLKPRISEQVKSYIDISRRFKKAIDTLK